MQKIAQRGLIILFSFTIMFHVLIIIQVIPFQHVWGGRLKTLKEMYQFESFSILLNLCFLMIVLIKSGIMKSRIPARMLKITLWMMAAFFLLNTIANLLSLTNLESWIFAPVTALICIFSFILARSEN